MVTETLTVAYRGIEAIPVTVQVQIASAMPAFHIVGLADKAVSEARERVRAALNAGGIALPAKRILVNLAPADLPKEGGHYDLPIAIGLLSALGIIPQDAVRSVLSVGELSLDGILRPVTGILPASVTSVALGKTFICAKDNGAEAVWADNPHVLTPFDLTELINHFSGRVSLPHIKPTADFIKEKTSAFVGGCDLSEVRGQETAKQALEITASGGHNLLMSGPPGAGKSMLASCLPDILPPMTPKEMLETSLIASVAGAINEIGLQYLRPYRTPHHSASMAALIGGGRKAQPGEISLAHSGVLFLDELPEFKTDALDALRQPLETGKAVIARAEHHITYPASFQLVAAMNPCKCGYLGDAKRACSRAPVCGQYYTSRLSGPLLDRFDIRIELSAVSISDLSSPPTGETTDIVRQRVIKTRIIQSKRAEYYHTISGVSDINARASGEFLTKISQTTERAGNLLYRACEKLNVTARGYHRLLRVARTLQDISDLPHNYSADNITLLDTPAVAGALAFRM